MKLNSRAPVEVERNPRPEELECGVGDGGRMEAVIEQPTSQSQSLEQQLNMKSNGSIHNACSTTVRPMAYRIAGEHPFTLDCNCSGT